MDYKKSEDGEKLTIAAVNKEEENAIQHKVVTIDSKKLHNALEIKTRDKHTMDKKIKGVSKEKMCGTSKMKTTDEKIDNKIEKNKKTLEKGYIDLSKAEIVMKERKTIHDLNQERYGLAIRKEKGSQISEFELRKSIIFKDKSSEKKSKEDIKKNVSRTEYNVLKNDRSESETDNTKQKKIEKPEILKVNSVKKETENNESLKQEFKINKVAELQKDSKKLQNKSQDKSHDKFTEIIDEEFELKNENFELKEQISEEEYEVINYETIKCEHLDVEIGQNEIRESSKQDEFAMIKKGHTKFEIKKIENILPKDPKGEKDKTKDYKSKKIILENKTTKDVKQKTLKQIKTKNKITTSSQVESISQKVLKKSLDKETNYDKPDVVEIKNEMTKNPQQKELKMVQDKETECKKADVVVLEDKMTEHDYEGNIILTNQGTAYEISKFPEDVRQEEFKMVRETNYETADAVGVKDKMTNENQEENTRTKQAVTKYERTEPEYIQTNIQVVDMEGRNYKLSEAVIIKGKMSKYFNQGQSSKLDVLGQAAVSTKTAKPKILESSNESKVKNATGYKVENLSGKSQFKSEKTQKSSGKLKRQKANFQNFDLKQQKDDLNIKCEVTECKSVERAPMNKIPRLTIQRIETQKNQVAKVKKPNVIPHYSGKTGYQNTPIKNINTRRPKFKPIKKNKETIEKKVVKPKVTEKSEKIIESEKIENKDKSECSTVTIMSCPDSSSEYISSLPSKIELGIQCSSTMAHKDLIHKLLTGRDKLLQTDSALDVTDVPSDPHIIADSLDVHRSRYKPEIHHETIRGKHRLYAHYRLNRQLMEVQRYPDSTRNLSNTAMPINDASFNIPSNVQSLTKQKDFRLHVPSQDSWDNIQLYDPNYLERNPYDMQSYDTEYTSSRIYSIRPFNSEPGPRHHIQPYSSENTDPHRFSSSEGEIGESSLSQHSHEGRMKIYWKYFLAKTLLVLLFWLFILYGYVYTRGIYVYTEAPEPITQVDSYFNTHAAVHEPCKNYIINNTARSANLKVKLDGPFKMEDTDPSSINIYGTDDTPIVLFYQFERWWLNKSEFSSHLIERPEWLGEYQRYPDWTPNNRTTIWLVEVEHRSDTVIYTYRVSKLDEDVDTSNKNKTFHVHFKQNFTYTAVGVRYSAMPMKRIILKHDPLYCYNFHKYNDYVIVTRKFPDFTTVPGRARRGEQILANGTSDKDLTFLYALRFSLNKTKDPHIDVGNDLSTYMLKDIFASYPINKTREDEIIKALKAYYSKTKTTGAEVIAFSLKLIDDVKIAKPLDIENVMPTSPTTELHKVGYKWMLCLILASIILVILQMDSMSVIYTMGVASFSVLSYFEIRDPEFLRTSLKIDHLFTLLYNMLLIIFTADSGFYGFFATYVRSRWKEVVVVINYLCISVSLLSILLTNNVVAILHMTPVAIRCLEAYEVNPVPVLIMMIIHANCAGIVTRTSSYTNSRIFEQDIVPVKQIFPYMFSYFVHVWLIYLLLFISTSIYFNMTFILLKPYLYESKRIGELKQECKMWQRIFQATSDYKIRGCINEEIEKLKQQIEEEESLQDESLQQDPGQEPVTEEGDVILNVLIFMKVCFSLLFLMILNSLHYLKVCFSANYCFHRSSNEFYMWHAMGVLLILMYPNWNRTMQKMDWATIVAFGMLFIVESTFATLELGKWFFEVFKDDFSFTKLLWIWSFTCGFLNSMSTYSSWIQCGKHIFELMRADKGSMEIFTIIFSLASNVGGSATLLGSPVAIACANFARQQGYQIKYVRYLKYALPITLINLVIVTLFRKIDDYIYYSHLA